jgi:hypothetical protein
MKNIRDCLKAGKIANLQIIPYPSGENLTCSPCPSPGQQAKDLIGPIA